MTRARPFAFGLARLAVAALVLAPACTLSSLDRYDGGAGLAPAGSSPGGSSSATAGAGGTAQATAGGGGAAGAAGSPMSLTLACGALDFDPGAIESGQSVEALAKAEGVGPQQGEWSSYVEFTGPVTVTATFALPKGTSPSSVTGLSLVVNYDGPRGSDALWTFEAWDAASGTWVALGDNREAADWVWTKLTFDFPDPVPSFFDQGGGVKLHYGTKEMNDSDSANASDLDEMVLIATTSG